MHSLNPHPVTADKGQTFTLFKFNNKTCVLTISLDKS